MEKEPHDPYEYEVDLRDYITVIWKQKWLIIAVFVLAVVLAGWYSMRQPSTYETQATLLITPRVSEQIVKSEEGVGIVSLPSSAYERSALAADLLDKMIGDLELENDAGELISVASLKNKLEIDVETKSRAAPNGETFEVPLVTMTVRGGEPVEIKEIANKWAELFQKRTAEIFSSETARSYQFISNRFEEVKEKLRSLEEEKQEYRENHPLESLKSQVSVLKSSYSSFLSQLEKKKSQLSSKRAEITYIQNTLDDEPKFLEPQRALSKEAIWRFLEGGIERDQLASLPGLKVSDQVVNELHFTLKERLNETRIDMETLEEEISYLNNRTEELFEQIREKQARINQVELKIERIDRGIDRLRDSYKTLSSNLEEARLANEEKESSVRIMEQAVAPQRPLSTNTKQNVAVAGVLGLFLGILAAFFKNYMEGYEEDEEEEGEEETSEE